MSDVECHYTVYRSDRYYFFVCRICDVVISSRSPETFEEKVLKHISSKAHRRKSTDACDARALIDSYFVTLESHGE